MVAPLAEGDWLKDATTSLDNESFRIVRKTSVGDNLIQLVLQRNASFSYCAFGKDGVNSDVNMLHVTGWSIYAAPPESCYSSNLIIDIQHNEVYPINQNLMRGHFDVSQTGPTSDNWIGIGYSVFHNRDRKQVWAPIDYRVSQDPAFASWRSNEGGVQSYVSIKQKDSAPHRRRFAFDFRHYNGSFGGALESPGQVLGSTNGLALVPGTLQVYRLAVGGTVDAKRGVINVWAGENVLREKSLSTLGDTITDGDEWQFCYAYRASECRNGSSPGDLYAVLPRIDPVTQCWTSQLNLRVACAFAGPVTAMQATQVRIDRPDPYGMSMRGLGALLMGPNQQYVFSKVLPTPDARYLLFAGFMLSGYHTGLMALKIPEFNDDSINRSTYIPIDVRGVGTSVYVEFGYEEFGASSDFYCTTRKEACRVSASTINTVNPFVFGHEAISSVSGSYSIAIPAISGRLLFYRVVDDGLPGPTRVIAVP
jgi:hypothetical protein